MTTLSRGGNIAEDVAVKAPCRVATTTNVALSGLQTFDNVTLADSDRVLVLGQTDPTQNGIYAASSGNWQRTTDARKNTDFLQGTLVYVVAGLSAGLMFSQTCADNPVVIDSSAIRFTEQSNVATAQLTATSSTSRAIAVGAQIFTIEVGKRFAAMQWVLAFSRSNTANCELGQITSYAGDQLAVNIIATGGGGTVSDWTIVLTNSAAAAGTMPPVGTGNTTGAASAVAGHLAVFADITGKVLADGGAAGALASLSTLTAKYLASSALSTIAPMLNGTIVESHNGGACTIAIKTLAGADPSAADPVWFTFRDATPGTGDFVPVKVEAPLSITIPSGATAGFSNGVAGRLWAGAILVAGAVELTVTNCRNGTNIFPLQGWGIVTTTLLDASADSAAVMYSATVRADVPYRTLGYLTWENGLAAAGTWGASPTRIQLAGYGVPLPGVEIQRQRTPLTTSSTTANVIPQDNTRPQSVEGALIMSQAITPTSAANLLSASAKVHVSINAILSATLALFQDSGAFAIVATTQHVPNTGQMIPLAIDDFRFVAGTTLSTTLNANVGPGSSATLTWNLANLGNLVDSYIEAAEIMA